MCALWEETPSTFRVKATRASRSTATFLCNERLVAGRQFQSRWLRLVPIMEITCSSWPPMPAIGLLRSVATELGDMVAVE